MEEGTGWKLGLRQHGHHGASTARGNCSPPSGVSLQTLRTAAPTSTPPTHFGSPMREMRWARVHGWIIGGWGCSLRGHHRGQLRGGDGTWTSPPPGQQKTPLPSPLPQPTSATNHMTPMAPLSTTVKPLNAQKDDKGADGAGSHAGYHDGVSL